MKPIIIAIAGGSASGKSSVVNEIVDSLKSIDITVICHDDYYKDQSFLSMEERRQAQMVQEQTVKFANYVGQPIYGTEVYNCIKRIQSYNENNPNNPIATNDPTNVAGSIAVGGLVGIASGIVGINYAYNAGNIISRFSNTIDKLYIGGLVGVANQNLNINYFANYGDISGGFDTVTISFIFKG